jgi:CheY-like chemotaxis protein
MPDAAPNILVVEDNAVTRMLVREMAVVQRWTVSFAENGTEGVAAAAAVEFDVILMDIHMPKMSGIDATRLIRESGGHGATVPIVAFTAAFDQDDEETWLEAGMDDLIVKPFNLHSLTEGLNRWLVRADGGGAGDNAKDAALGAPLFPAPPTGDVAAAEEGIRALLNDIDGLEDTLRGK